MNEMYFFVNNKSQMDIFLGEWDELLNNFVF